MPLKEFVSAPFEFPEPDLVLDLASRNGQPSRQVKYLHQIKTVSLIDGYLLSANSSNVYGIYLFARTLLELSAFLCEVSHRLETIRRKPDSNWKPKGEEFFGVLVRARFGTSDPKNLSHLAKFGYAESKFKPLNVVHSLKTLAADEQFKHLASHYDELCDMVHHNLSSQVAASVGFKVASSASVAPGGAPLLMTEAGPVTRYEYPLTRKTQKAVADTLSIVGDSLRACVRWLNSFPRTPFSDDHLTLHTGNSLGVTLLGGPPTGRTEIATGKTGRSEKCPCGSGIKYKHCCGATDG